MSTGRSDQRRLVQTRPPIRSRASTTTTLRPPETSRRAACSPATPAPMTRTSASRRAPASCEGVAVAAEENDAPRGVALADAAGAGDAGAVGGTGLGPEGA